MSYNIRQGRDVAGVFDLERTAAVIRAQRPDVVALQEVGRHWAAETDFRDQAADLARRLDMAMVYGANLDRKPAKSGAPRRQYGTAVFSVSPLLESRNILLPRASAENEQRGVLVVDIDLEGEPLRVLNAHLGVSTAERQLQVQAVLDEAGQAPGPQVLFGDLNAKPSESELAPLFEHFADAWAVAGEGDGFTFPVPEPKARIDYVLVSAHFTVLSVSVPKLPGSDHFPLVAELELAG